MVTPIDIPPIDPLCKGHRNVILVEGQDDLHLVLQLYKRIEGKDPNFCIRDMKGLPNLLADVNNEIRGRDRDIVGVIVDADDDPVARWKEVVNKIEEAVKEISESRIAIPQTGRENGIIVAGKPDDESHRWPRVGVWVMPNNVSEGEIEEFIDEMIPNAPVRALARNYIEQTLNEVQPSDDPGLLMRGKRLRAEVHAWLATRRQPRHMGAAISAGYLDTNGDLCRSFMAWLRDLFGDPQPTG